MSENEINFLSKVKSLTDSVTTRLTEISVSHNAWITKCNTSYTEVITDYGLGDWMSDKTIISVYFYIKNDLKIDLFIKCKVPEEGKSVIQLSIGDNVHNIHIEGNHYQWFKVAKFNILGSGYKTVDMKGVDKSGHFFADVSHLMFVHKSNNSDNVLIIRELDSKDRHFSRRGPSVHLSYDMKSKDLYEYYYNELRVPKGYDPIGSFFVAIGFDFGYFGLQVKSGGNRLVLFSIWSPQEVDDPNEVLEENKVILESKGSHVIHNVFGGEGCGGQSILPYMWSTDVSYRFLIRGRPDPNESNVCTYTAWFAEVNTDWQLIASFRRPKSSNHLNGFYSFVENFDENTGHMTRKAIFGNQWVCNTSGIWCEVTGARITGDSTAKNRVRLDFDGGIEALDGNDCQEFYLQNCGFIEGKTQLLSTVKRNSNKNEPKIIVSKLLNNI